jgi:hypothetical protein
MATIQEQRDQLIATIRARSLEQKALWQRIPYLALQADGIGGFSDGLKVAYRSGYWRLPPSEVGGHYRAFVDLATGEVVNPYKLEEPAWDDAILSIAKEPDSIEAQAIIDQLEAQAKGTSVASLSLSELKVWRKNLIAELGLEKIYTR